MKTERATVLYLCRVKRRYAKIMPLWAEPVLLHLVTIKKNATLESENASSNTPFIRKFTRKKV